MIVEARPFIGKISIPSESKAYLEKWFRIFLAGIDQHWLFTAHVFQTSERFA